jgi:hypothetical protein
MNKVTAPQVVTAGDAVKKELPESVQAALGDLAGAAKEGLLALSVGVGLGVVHELMEAEITEVVGSAPGPAPPSLTQPRALARPRRGPRLPRAGRRPGGRGASPDRSPPRPWPWIGPRGAGWNYLGRTCPMPQEVRGGSAEVDQARPRSARIGLRPLRGQNRADALQGLRHRRSGGRGRALGTPWSIALRPVCERRVSRA